MCVPFTWYCQMIDVLLCMDAMMTHVLHGMCIGSTYSKPTYYWISVPSDILRALNTWIAVVNIIVAITLCVWNIELVSSADWCHVTAFTLIAIGRWYAHCMFVDLKFCFIASVTDPSDIGTCLSSACRSDINWAICGWFTTTLMKPACSNLLDIVFLAWLSLFNIFYWKCFPLERFSVSSELIRFLAQWMLDCMENRLRTNKSLCWRTLKWCFLIIIIFNAFVMDLCNT